MIQTEVTTFEKYPEYKDSGVEWLGKVPKDWTPKKVFHYFRAEKGRNAAILTREFCGTIEGKFPVYSGQTENNGVMALINEYEFDYSKEGCLFTTTVGAKAMSVSFIKDKFSLSQNCMIIIRRNKKVLNKFFFYQFQTIFQFYRKLIPDHMQASFRMEDLYQYHFILPSFPEQTAIATFLDNKTSKIDTAIAQKEQMIALLKERKQIIIQNAVTGKWSMVNGQWSMTPKEKMKDSGVEWIGEIPEGWEVKRFRFVFNLSKGLTITKQNLQDDGTPCVNYGEIHSKYGFDVDPLINALHCVDEGYLLSDPNSLLKRGDFIFADTSEDIEGSGNFTYLNSDEKTFAGYHTIIARTKFDINSRFLAYSFDSISFRNQIRKRMNGVKVYSITQSKLKETSVWLPTPVEQEQIVNYIDKACAKYDESISLQQSQIEKLKEYKATLIDGAVTGKIKMS